MHVYMAGAAGFGFAGADGDDVVLKVYVGPAKPAAFCGANAGKGAEGDV